MIELLDPQRINTVAYDQGLLKSIQHYSLLPGKRIGWNYCMDYAWVSMQCRGILKPGMTVVDIGCGPGAIHGYLEKQHGIDIIGIDMNRWERDYVDIEGNFTRKRVRNRHGIQDSSVDCIISVSAFEHNKPRKHRKLVATCFRTLIPNGRLIVTFAAAKQAYFYKPSHQWNLSNPEIEGIYGEPVVNFHLYNDIWQRWHDHTDIAEGFQQRYGVWEKDSPPFLSVGAHIIKK
jgi:ubiquinone/menaquinone biosynthesis C-methylase UbiE